MLDKKIVEQVKKERSEEIKALVHQIKFGGMPITVWYKLVDIMLAERML